MKTIHALGYAVLAGFAGQATADDQVTIVNHTDRLLHFQMRCMSYHHSWKGFDLPPGREVQFTAPGCRYFSLEKSALKSDGDAHMVNYLIRANTYQALVFNNKKSLYELQPITESQVHRRR
jgi:hypothetical protein